MGPKRAGEVYCYLFVSEDYNSPVNLLCFTGRCVAVASQAEFAHALGFGRGGDCGVFFLVVAILLLGGGDAFGDTDGGGDRCEGEEAEDHDDGGIADMRKQEWFELKRGILKIR